MTDRIVIRERADADIPDLARVLVAVHALDGYPVEGVARPAAWIQTPTTLKAWVGTLDGHVVAHVALANPGPGDEAAQLWAQRGGGPAAVLCRLFVDPTARGHRIGAALTRTAAAHATTIGRHTVLDVMTKDAAAIRTYEALGWQRIGDITHEHHGVITAAYAYVYIQ